MADAKNTPDGYFDTLYGAEVTVLGIGNVILSDEGFGVRVAEYLEARYDFPENVQVLDGGTLGIELTQYITGTKKLLILDSINAGAEPGTRFRFTDDDVLAHFQEKISAHEIGIQDLLALLEVTGRKIDHVTVLGAQPYCLEAGVALSENMQPLVPAIAEEALEVLKGWGIEPKKKASPGSVNYAIVAEETNRGI